MKVQVIGHWSSTAFGTRADGETFDAPNDSNTQRYIERGYLREYETKVVHQAPKKPSPEKESTSSQAGQPAPTKKRSSKLKTKAK